MYGYGGAWWMFFMPLLSLGLLALIVWAVIRLVHGPRPSHSGYSSPPPPGQPSVHGGPQARAETARDVLDRRLAAGEIDIASYRAIRGELDGTLRGDGEP